MATTLSPAAALLERVAERPFELLGLDPARIVCLFASGSTVLGRAHARSDLDLYVVGEEPAPPAEARLVMLPFAQPVPVVFTVIDEVDVELQFWRESAIDALVERVSAAAAGQSRLSPAEISFFHRLLTGRPLGGSSWLLRRRRALLGAGLREVVADAAAREAESYVQDCEGLLSVGDLPSATLCARKAFGRAVDAALARAGDLSASERWRARRVAEHGLEALSWEQYWTLESMAGFRRDDASAWIEEVLAAVRALLEGAG
jgi:hypothetical protein